MEKNFSMFPKRYGFFPYIFLIYLLLPISYLTNQTSGIKQLIGFGLVLLFLVTYRQLFFISPQKKLFTYWLAIQLLIILIYTVFYDINLVFLGFFSANFIGYYREKKIFRRGLASLVVVLVAPFIYHLLKDPSLLNRLFYFLPFLVIMLISPYGIRSMNRRMELEQELDEANQQIKELVKREERVRIARDLHDTLGHTLSLLTLKSQLVQRTIASDPERARKEAREMETTSRAALKQVRELVSDMKTATIAEELIHIQQILRAADITFEYMGGSDFSNISPVTQNIVSMCIREAATNIVKHSRATHCTISISQTDDKISITIKDDGMGMDQQTPFGNGLRGMKERLALIDGALDVSTHNGTVLNITVPIVKKAERKETIQ
ncbi:MAG: sensor histidine kinase [Bacillus sp. (in: Bacteria)]|uniref:sensor histidine kinase n=1 Tax=Bacillus TaxID=1386 RepID=UPI0003A314D5|nr:MULTISPECIES: sensor histidine kinase [Bacillus]ETB70091.1 sensor histidine kinase [Bacillus sp. CPSM8]MBW4884531.1 sensor histidine kinase [Bacillus sp. (in: firmicutes)]OPF74910.1 two-component sensor histidine kinase [Bacillus paralicheniformis]UAY69626.1 sensor histidine kinase [Bacillus paralicheniformis]WAJ15238.1 sensor histidine kinase [Bacillus paralicheniformis]